MFVNDQGRENVELASSLLHASLYPVLHVTLLPPVAPSLSASLPLSLSPSLPASLLPPLSLPISLSLSPSLFISFTFHHLLPTIPLTPCPPHSYICLGVLLPQTLLTSTVFTRTGLPPYVGADVLSHAGGGGEAGGESKWTSCQQVNWQPFIINSNRMGSSLPNPKSIIWVSFVNPSSLWEHSHSVCSVQSLVRSGLSLCK